MFLGQFRVCSHQLRIDTNYHLARELWFCWLCLIKPDTEDHFIFWCSIYYDIWGWYKCIFWYAHSSISIFFQFPDHCCLTLYLKETFLLKKHLLSDSQHLTGVRLITSFFLVASGEGVIRRRIKDSPRRTRQRVHASLISMRSHRIMTFFSYNSADANTAQPRSVHSNRSWKTYPLTMFA